MRKQQLTPAQLVTKLQFDMVRRVPFYGNVLLRLKDVGQRESIPTAAAGPNYIVYNPKFLQEVMDRAEEGQKKARFIMVHELYHIVFLHPVTGLGKHQEIWNLAADMMVNHTIMDDKTLMSMDLVVPEDAVVVKDKKYVLERTTVQIYNELMEQYIQQGGSSGFSLSGSGDGNQQSMGSGSDNSQNTSKDSEGENQNSEEQSNGGSGQQGSSQSSVKDFTFHIAGTDIKMSEVNTDLLREALEKGDPLETALQDIKDILNGLSWGTLKGSVKRELDSYLGKKVKWYNYVKRFLTSRMSDEDSFDSPNKNMLWADIVLPGRYVEDTDLEDIIVTVDTSASITSEMLGEFKFHLNDIIAQFSATGRIIFWDTDIQADADLEDFLKGKVEIPGGGGTIYSPVVEYVNKKYRKSKLVITLTDGYWDVPKLKCKVPQLFVITSLNYKEKFKDLEKYGKVCYLN